MKNRNNTVDKYSTKKPECQLYSNWDIIRIRNPVCVMAGGVAHTDLGIHYMDSSDCTYCCKPCTLYSQQACCIFRTFIRSKKREHRALFLVHPYSASTMELAQDYVLGASKIVSN